MICRWGLGMLLTSAFSLVDPSSVLSRASRKFSTHLPQLCSYKIVFLIRTYNAPSKRLLLSSKDMPLSSRFCCRYLDNCSIRFISSRCCRQTDRFAHAQSCGSSKRRPNKLIWCDIRIPYSPPLNKLYPEDPLHSKIYIVASHVKVHH